MRRFMNISRAILAAAWLAAIACGGGESTSIHDTVGPPATMTIVWPDRPPSAPAGTVIPGPSVAVRDANDHPVPGVSVTFAVQSGGGALIGGTSLTDAQGVARSGQWQLGLTVGTQVLTAATFGVTTWQIFMQATAP
jgi:hypothetical protein